MEPFKWGIVSTEKRKQLFATEVARASRHHVLHAFVPVRENEEVAEENNSLHVYKNLTALLQSDVDAVYIASPHQNHFKQVRKCLKHQIPVLCERPIASTTEELKMLIRLSRKHKTFMMEAMWIRFMPAVKKVLSLIGSNSLGGVTAVKASIHYKNEENMTQYISDIGGGALTELGTYPVFLSALFLGKPSYVHATGNNKENGEDDYFSAFLSYAHGQYAVIEASLLNKSDSEVEILCDKGIIKIKNPWNSKPEGIEVDFMDGTKVVHKSQWEGTGLHFELDEVYDCIQKKEIESPMYCHRFSLDVRKTLDKIHNRLVNTI